MWQITQRSIILKTEKCLTKLYKIYNKIQQNYLEQRELLGLELFLRYLLLYLYWIIFCTWSKYLIIPPEKGMANLFSILALRTSLTVWKGKRTLKDKLPRSVGDQYATGDQWRNNSRKKEESDPKQKQHPVVDVTGGGGKVQCCKEQYWIGTWSIRSKIKANWKWSSGWWQEWT